MYECPITTRDNIIVRCVSLLYNSIAIVINHFRIHPPHLPLVLTMYGHMTLRNRMPCNSGNIGIPNRHCYNVGVHLGIILAVHLFAKSTIQNSWHTVPQGCISPPSICEAACNLRKFCAQEVVPHIIRSSSTVPAMANDVEFEVPVNAQDKCLKLAPGVHSEGPTVVLIMEWLIGADTLSLRGEHSKFFFGVKMNFDFCGQPVDYILVDKMSPFGSGPASPVRTHAFVKTKNPG